MEGSGLPLKPKPGAFGEAANVFPHEGPRFGMLEGASEETGAYREHPDVEGSSLTSGIAPRPQSGRFVLFFPVGVPLKTTKQRVAAKSRTRGSNVLVGRI